MTKMNQGGWGVKQQTTLPIFSVLSSVHRSPVEHFPECPACSPAHEGSNCVEGKKHGFRTSIKHLLQKRSNSRGPSDNLPSPGDSLKKSKPGPEGTHRKRHFSFKGLLKKKTASAEITDSNALPRRPDTLPLVTCYCKKQAAEPEEAQTTGSMKLCSLFCFLLASLLWCSRMDGNTVFPWK